MLLAGQGKFPPELCAMVDFRADTQFRQFPEQGMNRQLRAEERLSGESNLAGRSVQQCREQVAKLERTISVPETVQPRPRFAPCGARSGRLLRVAAVGGE